jgi:hypothetical protein
LTRRRALHSLALVTTPSAQRARRPRVAAVFFDFGGTLFSYRQVGMDTGRLVYDAVGRLGVEAEPGRIGAAYREAMRDASPSSSARTTCTASSSKTPGAASRARSEPSPVPNGCAG